MRATLAWRPPVWLQLVTIAAICWWLSLYMWGAGRTARWGLIDDHEILDLLGPDHRVSAAEVLPLVYSSEVRLFGRYVRFRPAYYTLRTLECWLWGDSPGNWYRCRIAMFGLSAAMAMWLLTKLSGLLTGILFTLYLATGEYWAAVWSKLGPAETYAVFGTALFFLGLYYASQTGILRGGMRLALAWSAATIGGWIALGSKENFVLLTLPALFVLWRQYRARSLSVSAVTAVALIAAGAAVVTLAIGLAVARSGHDIYMQSVNTSSRLAVVLQGLHPLPRPMFVALAAVLLAGTVWLPVPLSPELRVALRRYFGRLAPLEIALSAAYVAQVYYYNGGWTPESRYAFPGAILAAFMAFAPVALWLHDAALAPPGSFRRFTVVMVTAAVLAAMVRQRGFDASIIATRQNVYRTQQLDAGIRRVAGELRNDKAAPVAIWSVTLRDYEAYTGVRALLQNAGVRNPITLWTPDDAHYDVGGFAPGLVSSLVEHVHAIQRGEPGSGFEPVSILDRGACYAVGVWTPPPAGRCRGLATVFTP